MVKNKIKFLIAITFVILSLTSCLNEHHDMKLSRIFIKIHIPG